MSKIDAAKVQALIQKNPDLKLTVQSSFVRVDHPNGYRIYVSKSALVSQVHLSGFTYPSGPGITELPPEKRPTQQVKQAVDFSQSEEVILETIEAVLEFMSGLAKRETKKVEKEGKESPKGWSFEATTEETQPQA